MRDREKGPANPLFSGLPVLVVRVLRRPACRTTAGTSGMTAENAESSMFLSR